MSKQPMVTLVCRSLSRKGGGSRQVAKVLVLRRWKNLKAKVMEAEEKKMKIAEYARVNAKRSDRVYVWGEAKTGALGISSYLRPTQSSHKVIGMMSRPARLRFMDIHDLKVKRVDCGYGFTVFSTKGPRGNKLYGTGINTDSQLGCHQYPPRTGRFLDYIIEPVIISLPLNHPEETKIREVACGRAHTLVLTDREGVFSFGNNAYGQCGRVVIEEEIYSHSSVIHRIKDLPDNVEKVICGQDHSFFLTKEGEVFSCGLGADGQTGLEHYRTEHRPTKVKGDIDGERIIGMSSKGDCVLAVSDKGDLFGWGNSEYNQLATVTEETQVNIPRHIPAKHCGKLIKAVAGGSKCAALNDKGQVFVWGFGILGKGPRVQSAVSPELLPETLFGKNEVNPDSYITDIACGLNHFAALTNNYELYTWGKNSRGCLGLASNKDQLFPLKVSMPGEPHTVVCGVDHTVALCKSFS